ncbi:MAG: hypothetical protein ACQEW7_00385 [Pseudomonadota bacterium]
MTTQAHGQTTTKRRAKGQDVFIEPADLLFYMVGQDTLLAVPKQHMPAMLQEMRLLEAVVEGQQNAIENLKSCQDAYIQVKQANYFNPDERALIEKSDSPEALERKIWVAQGALDSANEKLRGVLAPVTGAHDPSNPIVELIPIQRRGTHASTNGFRMAYARLNAIPDGCRRYRPKLENTTPMAAGDSVITDGRLDWNKLKKQLTDIEKNTTIKTDIPWFDDWLKLEDQSKELFQWSKRLNESLHRAHRYQVGEAHEAGSLRVDLSTEAQLMRWGYGASGLSGEFNPFQGKASIKASGHAELMLAQARGTIDCYEPAGGYMMAFAGVNLGMLRSHTLLSVAGSLGASVAVELNLEAQFTGQGAKAKGIPGSAREGGVPGQQVVDMSKADSSQGTELKAFVGGEVEVTVAGQVEWKSPETDEFAPFAKIAPAVAGQAGLGAEATLNISYRNGKFRILAKAAFCFGVGPKGKLVLEVDAGLIWEFAQWVAYQLKNIDYKRLDFIDEEAFEALSNMLSLAIQLGDDLRTHMLDTVDNISDFATSTWKDIGSELEAENKRTQLANRISSNPDILKYTSPDTKGQLIYQLIQFGLADRFDPRNDKWNPLDRASWKHGAMSARKIAVMRIFTWVQSQAEFDNVMQRVIPTIGDPIISKEEGKEQVQAFLDVGEVNIPVISWFYTDFDGSLERFYQQLRPRASKGTPIVRNDMEDYLAQDDTASGFDRPCFNPTECMIEPERAQIT